MDFYGSLNNGRIEKMQIEPGFKEHSTLTQIMGSTYDKVFQLPEDPASNWSHAIHVPMRSGTRLNQHSLCHQIVDRISKIQEWHTIPDLVHEMHLYGCHVLFRLQAAPNLEDGKTWRAHLQGARGRYVAKASQLKKVFGVSVSVEKAEALDKSIKMEDVHTLPEVYNSVAPSDVDLAWVDFYFENIKTTPSYTVSHLEGFRRIGKALRGKPLAEWKNYLTFHWLQHFGNLVGEYDKFKPNALSMHRHKIALASVPWWQDTFSVIQLKPRTREMVKKVIADVRYILMHMVDDIPKMGRKVANMRTFLGGIPHDGSKQYEFDNFDTAMTVGYKKLYTEVILKFGKDRDPDQPSYMNCLETNACYAAGENAVYLPSILYQAPLVDPDNLITSFTGLGVIYGHELAHSFDLNGIQIDAHGVLRKWIPDEDMEDYNVTIAQMKHVFGSKRINEDFADLFGMHLTYRAFAMAWESKHGNPPSHTTKREFFEAFANVHATKLVDEKRYKYHSLPEDRVNKPLSVFPPFLEVYKYERPKVVPQFFGSSFEPVSK